jgi:glycosyltransferase involved in cell wall biosynthesis
VAAQPASLPPVSLGKAVPGAEALRAQPFRIVHLTSVHSAFDTRIFTKECRSLARSGFQVTIVAPHIEDTVRDGVRIKAVAPVHAKGRLHRMTRTAWQILREARRLNADIYHFHDPELIPAAIVLRLLGERVVYDIHENVPQDILLKQYLPSWSRRLISWLIGGVETSASRQFSALVTVSPVIAERFVKANPHTVLVHNFPDPKELAASAEHPWEKREPMVAFPGGILPERGIRQMVHAMACFPKSARATLEIASAEFPQDLWKELSKHPGWSRVRYHGPLSRQQVMLMLSRASAGLVLYLPEGQNHGAMPHKLFEYMAAGIPVIATDLPLWRRLLDGIDCVLFVNPYKPEAIAEAIQYVLDRPAEAARMGRIGREAVRTRYNWDSQARELVKLYNGLLGTPCAE